MSTPTTPRLKRVRAGDLRSPAVRFDLTVYHTKRPPRAAREALWNDLSSAGFAVYPDLYDEASTELCACLTAPSIEAFPPPSLGVLKLGGLRLGAAGQARLRGAVAVTAVRLTGSSGDAGRINRAAAECLRAFERRAPGIFWDEACREGFARADWEERVSKFDGDLPDVAAHLNVHAYQIRDHLRIVTLGMEKLGLPDIEVREVAPAQLSEMVDLVRVFAQWITERPVIDRPGEVVVDVAQLRNASVRERLLTTRGPGAGPMQIAMAYAPTETGDAENRLLRLRPAGSPDERQALHASLTSTLFGFSRGAVYGFSSRDPEIVAARERAQRALRLLRPTFADGPPVMQRLSVNARFVSPVGVVEWMWIDVLGWRDHRIDGVLENDPTEPGWLARGARVAVDEADVLDYRHTQANGVVVGNETAAVIARSPQNDH